MIGLFNPYKITGPAVISFSGGATSGFMLKQILDSYSGVLPDNIVVCFAKTDFEYEKSREFVKNVELNWGVRFNWLEYKSVRQLQLVNFDTANRNGKPFDDLIIDKQYLPNPVTRFCTIHLKIKTIEGFVLSLPGFESGYTDVMGLRFDEPSRVMKAKSQEKKIREIECPMYSAKHTLDDVDNFWRNNDFKLEIPRLFSNCVGCFLKGAGKLDQIARDSISHLEWWAKREETPFGHNEDGTEKKGVFRSDRPSYRGLIKMAQQQKLFDFPDDDTLPCNCTD